MFGSGVLDVAIGLVFIYLLLSLTCTALNEALASGLNKRGTLLFGGIKSLLNDPAFTGLAQQIYSHGLITGVSSSANGARRRSLPAYLNASTFSLALFDILSAQGAIRLIHGDLLAAAEQADDEYERARADAHGAAAPEVAAAAARRDQAFAALDAQAVRLQQAASGAAAAAQAAPQDAALADAAARARHASDGAAAAVKLMAARRAASTAATASHEADLAGRAAAALQQALAAGREIAEQASDALPGVQRGVESLPDGHTKESLLVLLAKTRREAAAAEDRVAAFQQNVERWFNDSMAHVSGWYKRWTQAVVAALAVAVVVAVNADTLHIVQRLARDSALRAALVTAAEASTGPQADRTEAADAVLREADSIALPLGWDRWPHPLQARPLNVLMRLLGLAISALAVSLGAPFWFDTLNKVINIRGAGTPPGEARRSAPRAAG
jgi:hypothetical protein